MVRADPEKNKGKLLKHELFEQRKVCDKLLHEIGVPKGYEPMTSRNHTDQSKRNKKTPGTKKLEFKYQVNSILSLPELKIQVNRSSSQNDLINKNSYIFQDEDNSIENYDKLSKNGMITLSSLPEINQESRTNSVNTLVNSDLKRQFKYANLK